MTPYEIFIDALLSLIPPVLVGGIFYVVMRSILRADSKERAVYAQMEAEMRAAQDAAASKPAVKAAKSSAAKASSK
jgi:hypothetical protein